MLISTFLLYVVIPVGPGAVGEPLDTGIFFALAVSSISVIGILLAGWASANKYSLIGGLRAAGQLIAYELPLVLAVVGVVMHGRHADACRASSWPRPTSRSSAPSWSVPFVIPQFVGFVLFLIAAQAELTQTPFDMPVAESELVAGYMTEYSGLLFLFFFIGEFGTAFGLAAIAATLFLGGWWVPLLSPDRRLGRRPRLRRAVRQDDDRRLPDLLGPLHLPALPGGPAPGVRLEVPHPHLAGQHPGDRRSSRWWLLDGSSPRCPASIKGLGVDASGPCSSRR